jgi:hypothetical protein
MEGGFLSLLTDCPIDIQDLTDCVNIMAANLTEQVRTIAHATVSYCCLVEVVKS